MIKEGDRGGVRKEKTEIERIGMVIKRTGEIIISGVMRISRYVSMKNMRRMK